MLNTLFGTLKSWNTQRKSARSLAKLPARALDDLGLVRGDFR
ncbi:DUF1127 domain-containing protein [Coralliovum pocilloporae]